MWDQFVAMVDGTKLIALMVLIGLDFLAGVILAIKEGKFQWSKLANFLSTDILLAVGGYYLLGFTAVVEKAIQPEWVLAAYAALDASLVAMVVAKLKKIWPGIPIPDALKKTL